MFLFLFMPVFKETIVKNEMVKSPFSTPGSVPLYNRQDGKKSKEPGYLSQFFGRQIHQPQRQLNVSAFID
jgi:hypothetical protein